MFKIFYISNCPYSSQTKQTIEQSNFKYELITCDDRTQCNNDIDYINISNTYRTFPKIFFKTKKRTIFTGGNEELQRLLQLLSELKQNKDMEITNQKYIDKKNTCYILIKLIKMTK